MKTRTILKSLALAMLMPAMLLTTACSNSDNEIINGETANTKGYTLPVTINVTRQGAAATRATFDGSKLSFSTGDKLFVGGNYDDWDKRFAGTLDYDAESGKFKGTIYTQDDTYKTYEDLFGNSDYTIATLLPAGYKDHGYLVINTNDPDAQYDDFIEESNEYTLATSKADGVAQFSYEKSYNYNDGFALSPDNAILNFTITGLAASTSVNVSLTSTDYNITGTVTTDASGNATFAAGIMAGLNLQKFSLTVAGNAITLVSSDKVVEEGKIYNINRSAAPAPSYPLLSAATTSDYGKVVCADGHLHDAKTAVPAGCTAVGIVGKVTETGHGLILALQDATSQNWYTISDWGSVTTYAGTTLKVLPDDATRGSLTSYTTLGATTVSNWALAQKSEYEAIFINLGSTTDSGGTTYDANVNAYITTGVGGTAMSGNYWSATEFDDDGSWSFNSGYWAPDGNDYDYSLRPVLGF